MIIRKYIKSLLQGDIKLYDNKGILINRICIMQEYRQIKNYLFNNFNKDSIVGLYLTKDYKYLLMIFACMDLGLTYTPLRKKWPRDRILQIEKISGCITLDDTIWKIIENYSDSNLKELFDVTAIDSLYIMFTSGTTGEPKGVIIKRESYENFLLWLDSYFDEVDSNDKMLFTTDFTFDISLVDIGLLLVKQLSLYISDFDNDIFQLLYELDKYKITVHSTVPYNYTMMINSNMLQKADLSRFKVLILAGSRFPYNIYKYFYENLSYVNLYNAYGPTEGTIYVTAHKMNYKNDEIDKNISIGKPVKNCKVKIIDDELCVSGVQIMKGYIRDKVKTDEVLVEVDGEIYYKTGDLVFKDKNGNYFVVGRKDDTVKVAGFRVNLLDIDAYIQSLDYIKDSATILVENKLNDDAFLVTYLILNELKDIKDIRENLKKILLNYQVAKKIILVDEFPLNNSGKVDRRALKNSYKG